MTGKARFNKLLEPGNIGHVKTKNRIIKTASLNWAWVSNDSADHLRDGLLSYHEALAKGGAGLIIVGNVPIDYPPGSASHDHLRIDDASMPLLTELTEVIHKHSRPVFVQMLHPGIGQSATVSGLQPLSASSMTRSELPERSFAVPEGITLPETIFSRPYDVPKELPLAEIEEVATEFAKTAALARKAGFDGVEINAGTHHLINSFLSRFWNKRDDAYGYGTIESRARFVVEIIQAIKKYAGDDFPVITLINGAEFGLDKGITSQESQQFARIFQEAGADAIHVRAYGYGDYYGVIRPDVVLYPEPPEQLAEKFDGSRKGAGALLPLAEAIKKMVSIPVITVGKLDHNLGEWILQQGKADFIGMTRCLLADPELPNKIASGRLEDIAPCTTCNQCISFPMDHLPVKCRINATLGNEREYAIRPSNQKKRVMVVGGGPAGMEAARVAALRGHDVTLYERENKLGGLLSLASLIKGLEFEDLPALIHYFKIQMRKLGVKIKLGKEGNLSVVAQIKPDVVILATGGIPNVPEIPGINKRNVVSSADLHRKAKIFLKFLGPKVLGWLTRFWIPFGNRVLIIGGLLQGCQLAVFLVKRGRKVTIVESSSEFGTGVPSMVKAKLANWLASKGVIMMTEVKYEEITDEGLIITNKEGKRQTIEADTIVPAAPLSPNTELFKSLERKVPEIYLAGDCREPHMILEAIADGYRIANDI